MFGAFKPSAVRMGGYLWKTPYKMSQNQKARQRLRLRAVDSTIATVKEALGLKNQTINKLAVLETLPKENEMPAKDKYWIFSKYGRQYRKGAHRERHFTKVTNRQPPKGF